MPTDLITRVAVSPAELDAAGEVCVAGYRAAGQLDAESDYAATLRNTVERARTAIVLVAVRAGSVVGTVTICSPGSPVREIGRPDEVEFRFLAVRPDSWRTGVGEALVHAVGDHARSLGARAVVLCVRDNNPDARRLYERLGFTLVSDRDWSPVPGVNLHVMTRPVAAS